MTRAGNLLVALGLLVGGCGGAGGNGDTIPPAARTALQNRAAPSPIGPIEHEHEHGTEMYETSWKGADGLQYEAKAAADGTVVEVEVEVPADKVPPAVRAAAEQRLAATTGITYVQLLVGDHQGHYEAEVVVGGKERDVVITPDGRALPDDIEDDNDIEDDHD